jgi:DNA (cytosine-5)-methyltransferase 1
VKPRLLDLFCGAGGCAKGYQRAGFHVTGVDINPQPNYCGDEFVQDDALTLMSMYPWWDVAPFDAIHASPPCPIHSSLNGWSGTTESLDLIPETRKWLNQSGLPYVIENVIGAPLVNATRICGQALGLRVRRHRLFEANFALLVPPCHHPEPPVIVVGGSIGRKVFDPRRKAIAPTFEQAKEVMEMPWAMRPQEVVNAVPPRYTELIGHQLMQHIRSEALAA